MEDSATVMALQRSGTLEYVREKMVGGGGPVYSLGAEVLDRGGDTVQIMAVAERSLTLQ